VPFVAAMNRCLTECQLRSNRPRLATALMASTQAQFDADLMLMTDIAKSSGYTMHLFPPKPLKFFRFKLFRSASKAPPSLTLPRTYLIGC